MITRGPKIITSNLILYIDPANKRSYSGSGTSLNDISGYNKNGILQNGVAYSSNNSGYFIFDGIDDYILGSSNLGISGDAEFTIAYWLYWNANSFSSPDYPSVIGNNTTGNTNRGLSTTLNGGRIALDFWVNRFRANSAISVKTWYYLSFTKTPGTISTTSKLYINGYQINGLIEGTDASPNILDSSYIVGRLDSGRYITGYASMIKVYNRALSSSEISQNFIETRSRFNI